MTTTSHLQKKPDFYNSLEDCINSKKQKINTNIRYRDFKQTHFTAGDTDQFNQYRDMTNNYDTMCNNTIKLGKNRYNDIDLSSDITWRKYEFLNAKSVDNTFNYMFNKFKKGIFVKIQNNKLKVFLPFSKKSFTNEWSDRIEIDSKFGGDMSNFLTYTNTISGKTFRVKVNGRKDSWYANNCLIRSEYPINEGDTNVPNMSSMLKELCEKRKVPDMEFFINRRDFPIITKDSTEAYDHMFGDNHRLVSHEYDKYSPILSMVTTDNNSDIPIPTGDDWARIYSKDKKYFAKECRIYPEIEEFDTKWGDKKPTAVFRGASTGCGVTIDTNMRLKLAYLSVTTPPHEDNIPLLDAGITKWQVRPRKLKDKKYLQTIDIPHLKSVGVDLVSFLDPESQSKYKYIVHVDGHVSAFRLSLELSMGSCILLVDSKYRLWFRNMLKPMVHYIPVKKDLSDLIDQIKWCRNHDKKCEEIAKNARKFYEYYLQKDGVLDYLQKLLIDIKSYTGTYLYNVQTPLQRQLEVEEKYNNMTKKYPRTLKNVKDISVTPSKGRVIGVLKGIEWIINMINDKSNFLNIATFDKNIFSNRLKSVLVDKYTIAKYNVVVKSTTDKNKELENIHEAFIGVNVINELIRYIPNFMYTFGNFNTEETKNNVIVEYINGKTFGDWIQSDKFNIQDYLFILIQLSLSLEFAQRNAGFVHYDLSPWNIMITELPNKICFDYILGVDKVYRVNTKYIPIIIDYGKSHVIYNKTHYGYINMFNMSTIQDIISILITSVNTIIKQRTSMSKEDIKDLVKLSNFLSHTTYRRRPFKLSGRTGVSDMNYFFSKAKKYNTLITSNKYDLEKRTPVDFIDYITRNFPYVFSFERIDTSITPIDLKLNKGNPMQVFEFILSNNNTDRLKSFTDVFERILMCDITLPDNIFYTYYMSQAFENNVKSVYQNMSKYCNSTETSMNSSLYEDVIKKISKCYNVDTLKQDEVNYTISDKNNIKYRADIFLLPQQVLTLLKNTNTKMEDISDFTLQVELMLLNKGLFKMSKDHLQYYRLHFDRLLKNNTTSLKRNIADNYSIHKVSKYIYKNNLDHLKYISTKCKDVLIYENIYKQILKYI